MVGLTVAAFPGTAPAAFPGENGRIAYFKGAGPDESGIFTILPDGSQAQKLVPRGSQPSWSADGRRIAFMAGSTGTTVSTMNADGGGVTQLVDAGNPLAAPSFSPSGKRIVFSGIPPGVNSAGIWTIRSDGGGLRRLLRGGELYDPEYSPNGKRIAFAAPLRRKKGIRTMRRDGSHLRRLTKGGSDFEPDYSPDGRHIVFSRGESLSKQTRIMRADGSREHGIPDTRLAVDPAYAPAGDRIVVAIFGDVVLGACSDLYTVSPSGADRERLTQNCDSITGIGPQALSPSWQPLPTSP